MTTMINVWTVMPADQDCLIDILTRATTASVVTAKGFRGATLLKGLDGTKVTMVAEWESASDIQALRANPEAQAFLSEALQIATIAPAVYAPVRAFAPAG